MNQQDEEHNQLWIDTLFSQCARENTIIQYANCLQQKDIHYICIYYIYILEHSLCVLTAEVTLDKSQYNLAEVGSSEDFYIFFFGNVRFQK